MENPLLNNGAQVSPQVSSSLRSQSYRLADNLSFAAALLYFHSAETPLKHRQAETIPSALQALEGCRCTLINSRPHRIKVTATLTIKGKKKKSSEVLHVKCDSAESSALIRTEVKLCTPRAWFLCLLCFIHGTCTELQWVRGKSVCQRRKVIWTTSPIFKKTLWQTQMLGCLTIFCSACGNSDLYICESILNNMEINLLMSMQNLCSGKKICKYQIFVRIFTFIDN